MVPTSYAINPSVYTKLPFDTKRDFLPISHSVNLANVLVVNSSFPAKSLQEFIDLAKKKPGDITYGSAGNGQSNHLSAENFKAAAGIQMIHVPYKGSSAAMTDLLGGNISAMFVDTLTATPQIKAGKLRALATSGNTRLVALPEVPTFAESGLPNFDANSWLGVVIRKGTPPEIAARIASAAAGVMHEPEVRNRLVAMGVQPVGSTPEQFVTFLDTQFESYAAAVKRAGVKLD
jgi:tripartite-type tricarboxylate transporter receptor subunit TctC